MVEGTPPKCNRPGVQKCWLFIKDCDFMAVTKRFLPKRSDFKLETGKSRRRRENFAILFQKW